MTGIIVGLLILAGLFFSAFFSGAETGLYCLNRLRLVLGDRDKDIQAMRLARLLDDEQGTLSVTLVGTNVMNYVTTTAAAYAFANVLHYSEADTEIYTIVILTPIVFIFGEVVPKNLFERYADPLMRRSSWMLTVADRTFRFVGIVAVLKALGRIANRLIGKDMTLMESNVPKRRVAAMLHDALAENEHGAERSDLIDRVCALSDTPLHAVMIPRNRVIAVSYTADRKEFMRVVRRTVHARLPVHDTKHRQVLGVVKVDELLADQDWTTVADRMLAPIHVSPHMSVAAAITKLQGARRAMAIVTDRGGRTLGIVTLGDLLREIVGELRLGE